MFRETPAAPENIGTPSSQAIQQMPHARTGSTIEATCRISADPCPRILHDSGLGAALDWLMHDFSTRTGIATDLVIDTAVAKTPEPIASALYRFSQESLVYATTCAHATMAEIYLEHNGDWVQLRIRDNGRTMKAADQDRPGPLGMFGAFGAFGIRERITLLGGEVEIRVGRGRRRELRVRIPLAGLTKSPKCMQAVASA